MIVASVCFTYGPAGIQAANFLNLFGALDRLGGLFVLIVLREFAPLVCAIVMAGVAGTAICADLGARKIREELDALLVLGVDPVKNLVVPRFLALMLATGLFNVYALIFGTLGGVLVTLANGAPLGPFFATYFNNATTTELWGSLLKTTLFGGDHRDRLLLQGADRVGRPGRASGARSTRPSSSRSWASGRSTTSSPRRCWPPTPSCRRSDEGAAPTARARASPASGGCCASRAA